jgi:Tfp pilus assembly protein PilO
MKIKIYFLPLSLVVVLFVFVYFIKPAWGENKQLKKELIKEQTILEELISKSNFLEKALSHYQQFSQDKELINNAMPVSNREDKLVGEINEVANSAGIVVGKIGINEQKKVKRTIQREPLQDDQSAIEEDSLVTLSVDIETVGEYTQIKKFIEMLNAANRFMKIELIDLSRLEQKEDQESTGMVSGKIAFLVFYKAENNVVAMSKLVSSGDVAMKGILTGKISDAIIENFKKMHTENVYELTPGDNQPGKENIFIGNTAPLQLQSQEETVEENQAVVNE